MHNLIDFFKKILSFPSITPDDMGALEFIEEFLEDFNIIDLDRNDTKNRLYYKKFSDDGEHLCFAGHIDVVPPGDGWDSDPFTSTCKDGKIFARGAQDMKSGLCAFIWAVKKVENFNGTLSILITSDEEGDASDGTTYALEEMEKINMIPDYALVAEPTCEKILGDCIKIGRRGSINGIIIVNGKQGHAAYPSLAINPINLIADRLPKLAGKRLDNGDDFFSPSEIVITDIRGGMEVTNVSPNNLKIMLNVRNSTKTSKQDLEKYINETLDGLDFELSLSQSAEPFMTDKNSKIIQKISQSIENILGVKTNLVTTGGTSDARFMPKYNIQSVEFGVANDTIHACNEYVYEKDVIKLEECFSDFIKNFNN